MNVIDSNLWIIGKVWEGRSVFEALHKSDVGEPPHELIVICFFSTNIDATIINKINCKFSNFLFSVEQTNLVDV